MFEGLNDLAEFFRNGMPYSIIYFIPLILIMTHDPKMMMVNASQEFQVYRMQQYDMPFGTSLGSRANQISMEARTINSKSTFISRRCVVIKLNDLSLERYRTLVSNYVGSILVILPKSYDDTHKSVIKSLEANLLNEEVKIPVYFIPESDEINSYYEYIDNDKSSQADSSALQVLVDSVLSNGFQFVINSPTPKQISQTNEFQAINLQGKLNGGDQASVLADDETGSGFKQRTGSKKIPTIIITSHYDAFGLVTSLSYGCDSNGSGVVALLELSRILSYLYSNSKTMPALNILFLLTAEGKFNYYGLKKWIDEQSYNNEMVGKIDLDDIVFAVCLDSLGKASILSDEIADGGLFMHVSKPPKEGQASFEFLKSMEGVSNKTGMRFEMIHKKINLANEQLAWTHEKLSINKIPAFTLSHFQSHKNSDRVTMTDTIDSVDRKILVRNIRAIAQAIIQYMYKNEDIPENLMNADLEVSEEFVSSWLDQICNIPRSASLLNKNHPLLNNLFSHFNHYLQESVKLPVKVPAREPEFVFYNEEQATLVIYNVKPAPFDLFLAVLITGYIGLIYLFVVNFGRIIYILNRNILNLKGLNGGSTNGVKSKSN